MAQLEIFGEKELYRQLDELRRTLRKKRLWRKPLREAAKPLVETAKRLAPVSGKPHHRYKNGRIIATYYPGNLRRSIRVLTFRRSPDVFVGYKFAKRGQGTGVFKGARVDGYYARWVEYRNPVLRPAYQASKNEVMRKIEQGVKKAFEQQLKKL